MGYMKNLAIRVEEQVERMLGIQGIEPGSPAWDEWKVSLVDSLQRWVDREFIQPSTTVVLCREQQKERSFQLEFVEDEARDAMRLTGVDFHEH